MDLIVFSAARRLAFLVAAALAFVAVPFARDARVGTLPAVSGGLALVLLGAALVPLVRAGRLLKEVYAGPKPVAVSRVYRASARGEDHEAEEREATHQAAVALLLLALAASLTIVAAAAR